MTAKLLKKGATYADLYDVPDRFVAELFDGDLYASPRPAAPHSRAASVLGAKLLGAFDIRDDGLGEWLFLDEPELHFGKDVVVPDLAGWRRERMPETPDAAYITLAPDWICEVLSPSTETLDRGSKLRVYAREGIAHAWLADPLRETLEVLVLGSGTWSLLSSHAGRVRVRAVPFDAIELDLGALWRSPR
jgi:Uma2 family endonuclease